jgi:hypothetical protein
VKTLGERLAELMAQSVLVLPPGFDRRGMYFEPMEQSMVFGPGRYDDLCSYVREQVGMTEQTGGGVVVIVIGGGKDPGFSVQADFETAVQLPDLLEMVAEQIRKEVAG